MALSQPLLISDGAVRRLKALIVAKGVPDLFLRLSVTGGGCAGFQYHFVLDNAVTADDVVVEKGGTRVVVDEISLDLLRGATLDYEEELIGAHFVIRNPKAVSGCGCGNSFSV